MKTTAWAVAVLVAAGGLGCKKNDEGGAAREKANAAASPEAGKARANASAGLWALAPAQSATGIVVGDGAPRRWLTAAKTMWDLGMALPAAKPLLEKGKAEAMAEGAPFDLWDVEAYAKNGIDLDKGAAVFLDEKSDDPLLIVLPVGDRKAFRTLAKATVETIAGREVDVIGHDGKGVRCLEAGGRYLCAKDLTIIDAAVNAHDSPLAGELAKLAPEKRGDLEVFFRNPDADDDEPRTVVATARIDATGLVARFDVRGPFVAKTMGALKPTAAPKAFNALAGGAGLVVRGHLDLAPILAQSGAPASIPIPGGVDARTDLIDQLGGDYQLSVAGMLATTLAASVKDGARVTKALGVLCELAKTQVAGAPVQISNLGFKDGTCSAEINDPQIAMALGGKGLKLRVAVEDGMLVVGIGDKRTGGDAVAEAGAPETAAALSGASSGVYWIRGLDLIGAAPPQVSAMLGMVPPDARAGLELASWLGAHVYEVMIAANVTDTGVDGVFRVTTFGGDPAAAQAAYAAALAKRAAGDASGYKDALAALAKDTSSLAGRQAKLTQDGSSTAMVMGAMAAVAIPAFMKYTQRAKEIQADALEREKALMQGEEALGAELDKKPVP